MDFRWPWLEGYLMKRRRVALAVIAALVGTAALVRILAPGRYDATAEWTVDTIERAPEPVVVAVTALVITAVGVLLLIELARLLYPAWQVLVRYVARLWDLLLPESPIIRFGAGVIVMVLLFLVGPLVVIQTLDLNETDGPVEQQTEDGTDGTGDDPAEDENGTGGNGGGTNSTDSPDAPPGDSGDGNATDGTDSPDGTP